MTTVPPAANVSPAKPEAAVGVGSHNGLRSDEARTRLQKFGPNAVPDTSVHPLRMALEKFWAPVPWMLEAAIVLELAHSGDRDHSFRRIAIRHSDRSRSVWGG